MQFELTEALIDDILFAMEDQMGEFVMDTVEGVVSGGVDDPEFDGEDLDDDDGEGGERYIGLPEWDSADGFRLMERFAAGFRNPIVRDELTSALSLGRGVFRAFKDTLGRHPEAEKLWFAYKDKEMRREIIRWYNGLREEWGIEKIGMEPEDTDDLVLEDFRFRPFREEDIFMAEELHRRHIEEARNKLIEEVAAFSANGYANDIVDVILKEAQTLHTISASSFEQGLVVESGSEEFAGYISGLKKGAVFFIQNLEVKDKFRGLGLGEALLVRFLESLEHTEVSEVLFDLPSWTEGFSRVLRRESFKPYTVRYWLKLCDRTDQ
jgi:ribosomal protein S18 acetylase RimI-like enzyme